MGEIGEEAYNAGQREKVDILRFLLDGFNDGRRKSFFCAAVNLLELDELRPVVRQLSDGPWMERTPPKERAAHAVRLLQEAAAGRGVELKLRKKK